MHWRHTSQTSVMTGNGGCAIQLLATLVDSDDAEESEYRFLVNGKHVKYVTVGPGVYPKDERTFAPVRIPMLPPFPPGDWNVGHISKDEVTGRPVFLHTSHEDLPGVRSIWHPQQIDHLELTKVKRIRQNIYVATCARLEGSVLVKIAEFPWQMHCYEAESAAYEQIEGKGIGPDFLGHVTEAGRVIGFVLEYLDDARPARFEDLLNCQRVLANLHAHGIRHGDINKYNFLVQKEKVTLIDFDSARLCSNQSELDAEYQSLERSLLDCSLKGKP
ncbi:Hypothetical protein R9X50_00073000 [Acrodontium crateriforme]|uniref:Uncharacterized protein n=1 Tax=Acrodontium crateriforme TaxID=150365 RepID=A0AAQ3LYD7_9PEZI|nr:Hypothetical protein R9X50_00073000 [Acrodontium crateriforme]